MQCPNIQWTENKGSAFVLVQTDVKKKKKKKKKKILKSPDETVHICQKTFSNGPVHIISLPDKQPV